MPALVLSTWRRVVRGARGVTSGDVTGTDLASGESGTTILDDQQKQAGRQRHYMKSAVEVLIERRNCANCL
ncbi:MAG: hypothetical protein CMJ59_23465 [Planctomycetaceae bacterium]|nr:hypothetical protein [Planctomycetaceae bacterium]